MTAEALEVIPAGFDVGGVVALSARSLNGVHAASFRGFGFTISSYSMSASWRAWAALLSVFREWFSSRVMASMAASTRAAYARVLGVIGTPFPLDFMERRCRRVISG